MKKNIDSDKGKIATISPANRMLLQELLASKSKSKNKILLSNIYTICNFIDLHASFVERKMNFSRSNSITNDDRILLETGQNILIVFQNQVFINALIKFNFLKSKFHVTNFVHKDPITKTSKKKISFTVSRVKGIDSFVPKEENALEDILKTYFNKKLKRELFCSLMIFFGNADNFILENIFLIFENEYKMQKWKTLIDIIVKNK